MSREKEQLNLKKIEILRKILFFLFWYVILYNLIFLLLAPEIYSDIIDMFGVVIIFIIGGIDTAIRPFSEKEREVGFDRYTGLLLIAFFAAPVILALSFHENRLIISEYFPIWNTLPVAILGYLIVIIGGIFTIVGRWQIGKWGSGILVVEDNHKLIKHGLFKYIRHPIYTGGMLGSFGSILIFRCIFIGTIGFLYNFFVLYIRLRQEEVLMLDKFGEEYIQYMAHTKRLIPFIF
ncbi:MAG: methyltransferase family protein [Candidatus Hodarchaeales archaeon]